MTGASASGHRVNIRMAIGESDSTDESDSAEVFRRSWNVYQKMVRHNWMCHREVYAALRDCAGRWFDGPFAVADFGCGDGTSTLDALAGMSLNRYVAIDRVQALLNTVPQQAVRHRCSIDLMPGDRMDVVTTPPAEPVDMLVVGFALHHFRDETKQKFLSSAAAWLRPGGRLVVADLVRRHDEGRRRYLDRFHRYAGERCGAFTKDERDLVRCHMEDYDFPGSLEVMRRLLATGGFAAPRLAFRDRNEFYGMLVSRRS